VQKKEPSAFTSDVEVPGVIPQDLLQQLGTLVRIGRPHRRHLRDGQQQAPRPFEHVGLVVRRKPGQAEVLGQCALARRAAFGGLRVHNGADGRHDGEQGDQEQPHAQVGTQQSHRESMIGR
jgi:hypothetical protein